MLVVSDTSCITTLLKSGRVDLLQRLYDEILIPKAVERELRQFHGPLPSFVRLQDTRELNRLSGTEGLGAGEADALALATELGADLILTDDRKARTTAQHLGLNCLGLVGVVLKAKQNGLITSLKEMLQTLQDSGGLYLSDSVKERARILAGE